MELQEGRKREGEKIEFQEREQKRARDDQQNG